MLKAREKQPRVAFGLPHPKNAPRARRVGLTMRPFWKDGLFETLRDSLTRMSAALPIVWIVAIVQVRRPLVSLPLAA
jgi:hypothetical protein